MLASDDYSRAVSHQMLSNLAAEPTVSVPHLRKRVSLLRLSKLSPMAFMGIVVFGIALAATRNAPSSAANHDQSIARGDCENAKPGDLITRELAGGQSHCFQLQMEANQFLHVVVDQQGIDVVLSIAAMDGRKLAEVDRPNGSRGRESMSAVATQSGTYLLQIRTLEGVAARGKYALHIHLLRAAESRDGERIMAERLVFEGENLRTKGNAEFIRQGIDKFNAAAMLWGSLGDSYEEAVAVYGAGISSSSLGENQSAIDYLERALRLFGDDLYGQAISQSAMGWPYMYLGEYEAALKNFSHALQFHFSDQNIRGQGIALYGIGWIYALRGQHQEALQQFSQSLARRRLAQDRRGEALTFTGIGKVQMRMAKPTDALDAFEKALKVVPMGNQYVEADIISNIGWAYSMLDQQGMALQHFNRALTMRRQSGDRIGEATTLYGLSQLLRKQAKLPESQSIIEDALRIIESLRVLGSSEQLRISYFSSIQEYYEYYIDLLMQMEQAKPSRGYAALALHASERARARGLIDLLSQARINTAVSSGRPVAQSQPLSVPEIQQQLLDENTVLLEYALGQTRSYCWLLTSHDIVGFELPPRDQIEKLAHQLYVSLTERNRLEELSSPSVRRSRLVEADAQASEHALSLSKMLLAPVHRTRGKRLLIVAPDALQIIPFAALQSPHTADELQNRTRSGNAVAKSGRLNQQTYRPLLVDHEIVMLPSASSLAVLRQLAKDRPPSPKTVAVLADPVFEADDERIQPKLPANGKSQTLTNIVGPAVDFQRLMSSRWEAQQIVALAPRSQSKLFLDFDANRSAATSATLGDYRFVHFATHALINNQHPELSSLVLSMFDAYGRPQDGYLRMPDIFKLKLPVEMVVLGACKTALGKDIKGEGLLNLTRAFMYAGSERVMVSFWDVSDKPTSELMVRLYRGMLGPEKLAPAAALRMAQLELWKDRRWQSPYYWAAFTLQGEPN